MALVPHECHGIDRAASSNYLRTDSREHAVIESHLGGGGEVWPKVEIRGVCSRDENTILALVKWPGASLDSARTTPTEVNPSNRSVGSLGPHDPGENIAELLLFSD